MNKKVAFSNKRRRTQDELREASKHVFWGMRYLSERLELILRYSNKANEGEVSGILNSANDSFLIHGRKMVEFLYNSSKNIFDNDLIAEDFFGIPEKWRDLRPKQSDILRQTKQDVGKLLVHFTYRAIEYSSGRFTWKISDIYVGVFRTLQKFLTVVDPSLLDKKMDYLRIDNPNIVICYPVFPPEGKPPYQIACTHDKASGIEVNFYE